MIVTQTCCCRDSNLSLVDHLIKALTISHFCHSLKIEKGVTLSFDQCDYWFCERFQLFRQILQPKSKHRIWQILKKYLLFQKYNCVYQNSYFTQPYESDFLYFYNHPAKQANKNLGFARITRYLIRKELIRYNFVEVRLGQNKLKKRQSRILKK